MGKGYFPIHPIDLWHYCANNVILEIQRLIVSNIVKVFILKLGLIFEANACGMWKYNIVRKLSILIYANTEKLFPSSYGFQYWNEAVKMFTL